MKTKLILGAFLMAALVSPASADYWIVQDQKSMKCSVVSKKPTSATKMVLAGDKVFKKRNEAREAMKGETGCK